MEVGVYQFAETLLAEGESAVHAVGKTKEVKIKAIDGSGDPHPPPPAPYVQPGGKGGKDGGKGTGKNGGKDGGKKQDGKGGSKGDIDEAGVHRRRQADLPILLVQWWVQEGGAMFLSPQMGFAVEAGSMLGVRFRASHEA